MSSLLLTIDHFLRMEGPFAITRTETDGTRQRVVAQLQVIALCGAIYGAMMGSFGGVAGDGWKQILLSGIKVPFLFLVTFALCLPSFLVMNALSGLHHNFSRVLQAILGFQSLASIVLAALAPITLLMNFTTGFYSFILLWNAFIFGIASVSGHRMMAKLYRPLIDANPRHAIMLRVWIVMYTFVGIQMAWVLRPFVGSRGMPFQIFRSEAWGNAYVEVARLILRVLKNYF